MPVKNLPQSPYNITPPSHLNPINILGGNRPDCVDLCDWVPITPVVRAGYLEHTPHISLPQYTAEQAKLLCCCYRCAPAACQPRLFNPSSQLYFEEECEASASTYECTKDSASPQFMIGATAINAIGHFARTMTDTRNDLSLAT